ncbi:MAG: calcium-binding protein [Hyphomicrobiaceae bacterium]
MATIKGTKKRDVLTGTIGSDTILGDLGNDDLFGLKGNDTLKGGAGNDKLVGGDGSDKLSGEAGKDTLLGGNGNDRLDGGTGDDTLTGGAGNDTVIGGLGADKQAGGAGIDTIDYSGVTGGTGVTIFLDGVAASAGAASGDTLSGFERAIGTAYQDTMQGTSGDDILIGGDSSDNLYGSSGADTLLGGAGDDLLGPGLDALADTINGGDGIDTVVYTSSGIGVVVALSFGSGVTMGGGAANDVLISIETIFGSNFDDELTVDNGGHASGGNGDDLLSGNSGFANVGYGLTTERLTGGSGADTFLVHRGTGADYISDFIPGVALGPAGDKLRIIASEFNNIAYEPDVNGASTAVRNIGAGDPIAANRASPQFIYDQWSYTLYFDSDGTGAAANPTAVMIISGTQTTLTHGGALFSVDEYEIV